MKLFSPPLGCCLAIALLLCTFNEANAQRFWIRKGSPVSPSSANAIKKTRIEPTKQAPKLPAPPAAKVDAPGASGTKPVGAGTPSAPAAGSSSKPPASTGSGTKPTDTSGQTPADSATSSKTYAGVTFSNPVNQKWRVGVVLITGSNPVQNVYSYIPIPKEWPEQTVQVFDEEIPVEFAVQEIDELEGLNRLILRGQSIPAKRKIVALQTFIVTTKRVNAPADTSIFVVPDSKNRKAKKFTESGSDISFRNNALRKQAAALVERGGTAWEQVERIYDWVRDNIDQGSDDPYGTLATFAKKAGHPEDVVGLFIAMCRANGIPARMVFVDGTQYAEFMLADPAGELHWFPADVVGIRAFGKIVEPKVILQKGDNIRIPGQKAKKKFVAAYGEVKSATKPRLMEFVREPLSE